MRECDSEQSLDRFAKVVFNSIDTEVIICPTCNGNTKVYPPNPNECDVEPVICETCLGKGRLVKETTTRMFTITKQMQYNSSRIIKELI